MIRLTCENFAGHLLAIVDRNRKGDRHIIYISKDHLPEFKDGKMVKPGKHFGVDDEDWVIKNYSDILERC